MQVGLKVLFGDIREQTVKLTFFSDVKLGGAVEGATKVAIEGADAVNDAVSDAVKKGIIDAVSDAL